MAQVTAAMVATAVVMTMATAATVATAATEVAMTMATELVVATLAMTTIVAGEAMAVATQVAADMELVCEYFSAILTLFILSEVYSSRSFISDAINMVCLF